MSLKRSYGTSMKWNIRLNAPLLRRRSWHPCMMGDLPNFSICRSFDLLVSVHIHMLPIIVLIKRVQWQSINHHSSWRHLLQIQKLEQENQGLRQRMRTVGVVIFSLYNETHGLLAQLKTVCLGFVGYWNKNFHRDLCTSDWFASQCNEQSC